VNDRTDDRVWKQIGAMLGGLVCVATIHALVIVPAVLDAAQVRAAKAIEEAVAPLRQTLAMQAQLDRIEARLAR
jgi:hypothetical protein